MWWLPYSLTDPSKIGGVSVNTEHGATKKPVWLVSLKLAGLTVMTAIGYALVLPLVPLPLWQAIMMTTGLLLVYVGVAFLVRPEPNMEDLGWCGGLVDNPFSYSDGVNRWLWSLHCLLGPGRFAAETALDACVLLGLMAPSKPSDAATESSASVPNSNEPPPLSPDRFRRPRPANEHGGLQELSSARFLNSGSNSE